MTFEDVQANDTASRRGFITAITDNAATLALAPVAEAASRTAKADVTPMRRPREKRKSRNRLSTFGVSAASTPALPPTPVLVLNKMGFGPRPGDIDAFLALGEDDDSRIAAYVEQQLNPFAIDDSELEDRLLDGGFSTLGKSAAQLWNDHVENASSSSVRYLPYYETERAAFTRAIYSRRQLFEFLADFWHNHFNVYGRDYWAAPHWVYYDRDVIRGNMLGNFRKMLEDVAKSVPMLYYLDNYTNTNSGPNENFARELFELHGLGAENYYGVIRQHEVPRDDDGFPMGYCDDDVYEATRCLTGWTLDYDTGEFLYIADRHDRFQKSVLGAFLPPDQPPTKDGLDVLDLIARHPGTARHIARKLCRRFIADDPPQRIVDEAAAVFRDNVDAPDQLKKVTSTILLSPEFRSTWGRKIKRPFDLIVSCMRAVDVDFTFTTDDTVSNYFMREFERAGQPIFRWSPPDGFPDEQDHWMGNNTFIMNWRLVNWLVEVKNWWSGSFVPFNAIADTPSTIRTAEGIADFWIDRILGRPLPATERTAIVNFMAAGRNPQLELPIETNELLRERVWGTIALIMMTPANLLR